MYLLFVVLDLFIFGLHPLIELIDFDAEPLVLPADPLELSVLGFERIIPVHRHLVDTRVEISVLSAIVVFEVAAEPPQNLFLTAVDAVDDDVDFVVKQLDLVEGTFHPLVQRPQLRSGIPTALVDQVGLAHQLFHDLRDHFFGVPELCFLEVALILLDDALDILGAVSNILLDGLADPLLALLDLGLEPARRPRAIEFGPERPVESVLLHDQLLLELRELVVAVDFDKLRKWVDIVLVMNVVMDFGALRTDQFVFAGVESAHQVLPVPRVQRALLVSH
jgi:hypothetical protein